MQQSCTYGSVRGASGKPASLPRQKVFTCHPERSEGSHVFEKARFFAALRMTIKVKRFMTHYTRLRCAMAGSCGKCQIHNSLYHLLIGESRLEGRLGEFVIAGQIGIRVCF